ASEIDALGPFAGGKERGQSALELAWETRALLGESQQVPVRSRMEPTQQRQDLVTDQPPLRVRVRGVCPILEAVLVAIAHGVLTPDVEQRPHDPVLALALDALGVARRHEPIQ